MDDARFPSKRIWLVDSNPHSRDGIARVLEAAGWDVALFGTLDAALETAGTLPPALACIDAETSRRADSMRRIEAALPDLTCVVLIAANEIDTAVAPSDAVHEYVEQPVNGNRLVQAVERAAERSWLRKRVRHLESTLCAEKFLAQIAGESQAMRVLSEQVGRLGESNAPVCILGESGSGKDVVARAVHAAGRQHSGALVTVSCTATPKALQAAELCGEERSSDASERLTGRFEDAQGGTLFFDEVSELSLAAQAALLGALRHRSFPACWWRRSATFYGARRLRESARPRAGGSSWPLPQGTISALDGSGPQAATAQRSQIRYSAARELLLAAAIKRRRPTDRQHLA
ncbi:MAG: sigma-54-dependent Fis family transcriptional regulator [Polyangiaceae bacterium]|nr:sigma-54-dependent Fis family transcriptional regulator [Myxococcales bacterium]MCB9584522.1 sigma-54-dependent Fis family transcriptional regulator [Polyangiaceae bacterium]